MAVCTKPILITFCCIFLLKFCPLGCCVKFSFRNVYYGLYSRLGSPSTSHRWFVTFTGFGCPSGLSLNSCARLPLRARYGSAIPCTRAAPCGRHRLTATTALRVHICARSAIDASCYHRRRRCACLEHSAGRRHVIVITACL